MSLVAGIGLRAPHLAEVAHDKPATAFLEIHAENYLSASPALKAIEGLPPDYVFLFMPSACRWALRTASTKPISRASPR